MEASTAVCGTNLVQMFSQEGNCSSQGVNTEPTITEATVFAVLVVSEVRI